MKYLLVRDTSVRYIVDLWIFEKLEKIHLQNKSQILKNRVEIKSCNWFAPFDVF